jgi:hypothetical protein
MTFLNFPILLALSALAIPVAIHLLNRSKARVVPWGAMRFLSASLAVRSRRIMIEEIALLVLRCMVVALAVLAAARPFLPSRPTLTMLVVIPAVPAAAVLAALAASMWSRKPLRLRLLILAGLGLLAVPGAGALEKWYQAGRWDFGGGPKDVAIVIDGSMSMTLPARGGSGRTNFDQAVHLARAAAANCGPGDGISLVVAGAVPRAILASPSSNRNDLAVSLDALSPMGGTMRAAPALLSAAQTLAGGANPGKKIILITDGQKIGWDVRAKASWRSVGAGMKGLPTVPDVIVATLPAPRELANLAVTDILPDRRVIGADREVRIDVHVRSTGTDEAGDAAVTLLVDATAVGTKGLSRVPPGLGAANAGAGEIVRFSHRFSRPGRHVLTARLEARDGLRGDNVTRRVVDVRAALGVLIVDGSPSSRPLGGAADFIDAALSAGPVGRGDPAARPVKGAQGAMMATTVVAAADAAKVADLHDYSVVVLADVPMLAAPLAEKVSAFVAGGGGLLIAPGPQCRAEFYNAWRDAAGRPVVPARLGQFKAGADARARLSPTTFDHPALARIADEPGNDAGGAAFTAYWRLEPLDADGETGVGGSLDTGEPFVVERKCGKGRCVMLAGAMDARASNLPTLNCFLPLLHEMVCYLAEGGLSEPNSRVGRDVTIELPGAGKLLAAGDKLEVVTPGGARRWATVTPGDRAVRAEFNSADEPGLYRLLLPPGVAQLCSGLCPDGKGVPFVVVDRGDESDMAMLADADLQIARGHVRAALDRQRSQAGRMLVRVENADELLAAVSGGIPGRELWQYVAAALVLALLAETAFARWIAWRRRAKPAGPVEFGRADQAADQRPLRASAHAER